MKDPLDDRLDPYALLDCSETCTRAEAQRSYTAQLIRRAASQADLQAAREILVRADQRVRYDIYRHDVDGEGGIAEVAPADSADATRWTSPEPPDLKPWIGTLPDLLAETPIEFDS